MLRQKKPMGTFRRRLGPPRRSRFDRRLHEVLDRASGDSCGVLLGWARLKTSKYHSWKKRYGKANSHNGKIHAIGGLKIGRKKPFLTITTSILWKAIERMTFMMLDEDVVACQPEFHLSRSESRWAFGS